MTGVECDGKIAGQMERATRSRWDFQKLGSLAQWPSELDHYALLYAAARRFRRANASSNTGYQGASVSMRSVAVGRGRSNALRDGEAQM